MYMMIDVETDGLQGEAFAVGYVIFLPNGNTLSEDMRWVKTELTDPWCKEHIPCMDPAKQLENHQQLRAWFVKRYLKHKPQYVCADHIYPCESNFLALVSKEHNQIFYPLIDTFAVCESIKLHTDLIPFDSPRNDLEVPRHNPLCDARQSVRQYLYYLDLLRKF